VLPADHPAFGAREIADLFAPIDDARRVALAVSGGPDSLALLLLAERWRAGRERSPETHVFTVDHRLQPRSAEYAAFVAHLAAARRFPVRILVREGDAPVTGIEAGARDARYGLLIGAAKEAGASHLLLAHQRDEQAETFLMRLARGSGVHGLAAMRRLSERDGVTLFRPFLDIPKARLESVVRDAGIDPVDDAANRDPRFMRTRLRALMPELARAGLGPEQLVEAARQMARAADAIDAQATELLRRAAQTDRFAIVTLAGAVYRDAPEEVRLRALTRLLQAIGGGVYPPRSERLTALDAALCAGGTGRVRRTLAGVVAERTGDTVLLYRELGRHGLPVIGVAGAFEGVWDNRFRLAVTNRSPFDVAVSALGASDVRLVSGALRLPKPALAALPAIRRGERLLSVPSLDFGPENGGMLAAAASVLGERLFGVGRSGTVD
jgi:tRNA(Ile)-lysidine synthase